MKITKTDKTYSVTVNRKLVDIYLIHEFVGLMYIILSTLISRFYKKGKEPKEMFYFTSDGVRYNMIPKRINLGLNARVACVYSSLTPEPVDGVCNINMYVDGFFMLLPLALKQAVAAHELGHCIVEGAKPKNGLKYNLLRLYGFCPKEEILADSFVTEAFGADVTRKMLKALFLVNPFAAPELIRRYAAVGKK